MRSRFVTRFDAARDVVDAGLHAVKQIGQRLQLRQRLAQRTDDDFELGDERRPQLRALLLAKQLGADASRRRRDLRQIVCMK